MSLNKKGEWIGTLVTVERSVNDLILVDDALSESMLNPNIQKIEVRNYNDETENDKIEEEENQSIELMNNNDGNVEPIEDELITDKGETDETGDKVIQNVRRSNRNRKQRFNIHPDEIGECEDEKDEDYR